MKIHIKNRIAVLLCFLMMISFAAGFIIQLFAFNKNVSAEETSQAYFLTEDRDTRGLWYNGENGAKDNPEADRNYGKDGAVLFYHWLRADGQPEKNIQKLNDFSNDTNFYYNMEKSNYVEYPAYVSLIEGNIQSYNDTPHGYWMNGTHTMSEMWVQNQNAIELLPIDGRYDQDGNETRYVHGGFCVTASSYYEFDVTMSDNEWHVVSLYIGCPYTHKYNGYDAQEVSILSADGTLLATYMVDDPNMGVYVSFAVKGSFTIRHSGNSQGAWGNGLFFDPYVFNEEIAAKNFNAQLSGVKDVNLSWENADETATTTIFRRVKGETLWDKLVECAAGVTSYVDKDTKTSTTYEYAYANGIKEEKEALYNQYTQIKSPWTAAVPGYKAYNLADFENIKEVATAPYKQTKIEFSQNDYINVKAENFTVKARLYKTDDEGATWVPYSGVQMNFSLTGENVESVLGVNIYPNMNDVFGTATTDSEGYAEVTGAIPYAGEYQMMASIEAQPNPDNENEGYDASSSEVYVVIEEDPNGANPATPFITSVTDAVESGDTVILSGFNMQDDGALEIAYRRNQGTAPLEYDELADYYTIPSASILVTDNENGTGLMFVMPNVSAGMYDFYVKNSHGWSNGITMNATRPMYMDQEAAYAGQEIQIVGRNFLQYEYGVGNLESSLKSLAVRLTYAEAETKYSITLTQANGGILTTSKITAEEALQFESDVLKAEDIPYTHQFRITIKVPDNIALYGKYSVSVASDGKDFREMSEPIFLEIVQKKAKNWDETVFGSMSENNYVGNDPLDLGAYWAQDLNYTNVRTMTPNTFADGRAFMNTLNNAITELSNAGGGVVYFPEGEYYVYSDVNLKSNVILVGAGQGKTTLYYANNQTSGTVWFRGGNMDNIGIARMTLSTDIPEQKVNGEWYVPNFLINWGGDGEYNQDIDTAKSKNKFVIDVDFKANPETADSNNVNFKSDSRQMILIGGEGNIIYKNLELQVAGLYTRAKHYTQVWNVKLLSRPNTPILQGKYVFIENSYFDCDAYGVGIESHGLSIRSDTYVAYTYVTNTGARGPELARNDGESLLVEVPSGYHSTGYVLDATERTITLDYKAGTYIQENTSIHYNKFAVYIADGTGQGQYRYIERAGVNEYGNCYELMEGESDWDIIPDSTSIFSIINPIANVTVYHFKAYDCAASLCMYYNTMDAVVYESTLVDTAGITLWGSSVGGMNGARTTPSQNVRIEKNDISGVGANYNEGISKAQGTGGIQLVAKKEGDYIGVTMMGITVRDNYLHDLIPDIVNEQESESNYPGMVVFSSYTEGMENANRSRYIVIENNTVENAQGGIYVDKLFTGVVVRNNVLTNCGYDGGNGSIIYQPSQFKGLAKHTFYVNGEVDTALSGEYMYDTLLPELPSTEGKAFIGWTTDEQFTDSSAIVTHALIKNTELYAVFGYSVTFDYNYVKSDNTQKGQYFTARVLSGETVKAELDSYGDPFRAGDDFEGWYLDSDCTKEFDPDSEITQNLVVYAKWSSMGSGGSSSGEIDTGNSDGNNSNLGIWIGVGVVAAAVIAGVTVIFVRKEKKK